MATTLFRRGSGGEVANMLAFHTADPGSNRVSGGRILTGISLVDLMPAYEYY